MAEPDTVIIFTSVLILAVVEISRAVRDESSNNMSPHFHGTEILSAIHILNYFLLTGAWYITGFTEFGNNRWILYMLAIIYFVFMVFLPLLESSAYQSHIDELDGFGSFRLHILLVIITLFGPGIAAAFGIVLFNWTNLPIFWMSLSGMILGLACPYLFIEKLKLEALGKQTKLTDHLFQKVKKSIPR